MDTLKNKRYEHFDYLSRYTHIPYYYDTLRDREVFGIGTQMEKNISYISHKLLPTDTLDSLALKYYNNPTLWWVIAYYNNILDSLEPLKNKFDIIRIPSIASIEFKNERN